MEVEFRIDANELHQKTAEAREDEIRSSEPADGFGPFGELPDDPEDEQSEEQLVDGGGLDEGVRWRGWNQRVLGHMHTPGQRGVDAVVAIAGGEAADAADAVTDSGSGGGKIEHAQTTDARTGSFLIGAFEACNMALPQQHGNTGEEATVPGEAGLEPAQETIHVAAGVGDLAMKAKHDFGGVLELVPGLGAENAGQNDQGNHVEGVGVDAKTLEILVQNNGGADGGEPEHQAEGAYVERANVDVGIHADLSIRGDGFSSGRSEGYLPLRAGSRYPTAMSNNLPEFVAPESMDILYSCETIQERVKAIGDEISKEYEGKSIVLIGVLKGAAIFLADLARAIKVDNTFDFVAVSSYGRARVSSGAVKLIKDIDNPIEGKHVIIVEDILDTGLTLSYLRGLMLQHKPASLKIATCLDKPERRLVPIEADFVCFKIPNRFVIGYGMDFAERYRGVPDIRLYPDTPPGH
jgi:hypoxanthine phosphoribosyltransferase